MSETGQLKEKLAFGSLEVKVLEVRELPVHLFIVRYELAEKATEIKKHASATHTFQDVLNFKILRMHGDIEVEAWHKHKLLKDKMVGYFRIPLRELENQQVLSGWFPLSEPDKAKIASPHAGEKSTEQSGLGEVRLEMKLTLNEKPKETLHGIVINDQWTAETSGGSLINNRHWTKNHQFLLTVEKDMDVTIRLRLPENSIERGSFYLVKYDTSFYHGRPKRVLDTSEIIKVENFFCPITSLSVDSTVFLAAGEYIVIPFTEAKDYVGSFTINAYSKDTDSIDFIKLPKGDKPEDIWTELSVEGEWTEKTAGGGDILTLAWTKNPQYILTLRKSADVALVLSQDNTAQSIGFYVIKQTDLLHHAVSYDEEVSRTDGFKYTCSIGTKLPRLQGPGSYVVIPATFDPDIVGHFVINAFSGDPDATLKLMERQWSARKEITSEWTEKNSGGAPNFDTFASNPQFSLKVSKSADSSPISVLVQLIQESVRFEEASIGFLILKRDPSNSSLVAQEEVTENSIAGKPNGWVQKMDVICTLEVSEEGGSFVVIPSTFKQGVERPFRLIVYADVEIDLKQIEG